MILSSVRMKQPFMQHRWKNVVCSEWRSGTTVRACLEVPSSNPVSMGDGDSSDIVSFLRGLRFPPTCKKFTQ